MEQKFIFRVSTMDLNALVPQVSYGLEKQVELESRKSHPQMWEITDRLKDTESVPENVQEKRRKRRNILAVIECVLGLVLLAPGLLSPKELIVLLLMGAASYASGVVLMWNGQRSLLAVLSILQGILFSVVSFADRVEMGKLLILGAAGFVVGIAALVLRRRLTRFERAAIQLMSKWQQLPEGVQLMAAFSEEGMTLSEEGKEGTAEISYDHFERAIETVGLFLMIFDGNVTVLQKKDLTEGTLAAFQTFLKEKMEYIPVG